MQKFLSPRPSSSNPFYPTDSKGEFLDLSDAVG